MLHSSVLDLVQDPVELAMRNSSEEVSLRNPELATDRGADVCVWGNCNDPRDIVVGGPVVGSGGVAGVGVPDGAGGGRTDTVSVARIDLTFLKVLTVHSL